MIDKHRDPPIRALLNKPWLFLDVLADVDALEDVVGLAVGFFEFLEDDGGFVACAGMSTRYRSIVNGKPTIGRAEGQQLEALVGDQAVRSRHIARYSSRYNRLWFSDRLWDDVDEMSSSLL